MGSLLANRPKVLACLSAVLVLILFSSSALAQSDSYPKWDLFAGYQWLHPGATVPLAGNPNNPTPYNVQDMSAGFGAAVGYNFRRIIQWLKELLSLIIACVYCALLSRKTIKIA